MQIALWKRKRQKGRVGSLSNQLKRWMRDALFSGGFVRDGKKKEGAADTRIEIILPRVGGGHSTGFVPTAENFFWPPIPGVRFVTFRPRSLANSSEAGRSYNIPGEHVVCQPPCIRFVLFVPNQKTSDLWSNWVFNDTIKWWMCRSGALFLNFLPWSSWKKKIAASRNEITLSADFSDQTTPYH